MKKYLVIISLLVFQVGCATQSVSSDYSLNAESNKGLFMSSVKYQGLLSGYNIYFRGVDNKLSGRLEVGKGTALIPIHPQSDFNSYRGKLQLVELPAGSYEIYTWHVASGMVSIDPAENFSIPFTIEKGEITYIGSFVFKVTDSLGLTVTNVDVTHENHYKEDLTVAKEKYPGIGDSEVKTGIGPDFTPAHY